MKGKSNTPKETLRVQLAEQILSASTQDLKKPQFVFRPPPLQQNGEELLARLKKEPTFELKFESYVMLEVFKFLGSVDLSRCASVCKAWNSIVQVIKILRIYPCSKTVLNIFIFLCSIQ